MLYSKIEIALLSFMLLFLTACGGSAQPAVIVVTATATNTPLPPTDTPTPEATPTPGHPMMGQINFALEIENEQLVNPATSFQEGVSKVHVLFEHQNMAPGLIWERVWLHNETEMLRTDEPWAGEMNGSFAYFLDSGETPLSVGEWTLELYVDGEKLTEGSFMIEAPPTATPTQTHTPQPTPTETPTSTTAQTQAGSSPRVSGGSGGGTYRLVFSRWVGEYYDLYIADTNGNNQTFIIQRAAGPSWSNDGSRLYFFGEQGINQQIREGRIECDLGTISGGIVALDLPSPVGDVCNAKPGVWFCERRDGVRDVCHENGVSFYQNLDWKEGTARWANVAPTGDQFAYDGKPGGSYRIYFQSILDNQRTPFELIGEQGDWSPNGRRLVYRSGRDNKAGIWISNRDDTGHTLITNNGADAFPAWSPDGTTIAFTREQGGNVDIYTMNVDGSNIQQLTDAPGPDTVPVFTPSGDIIFRSARTGSWSIWKMSRSGGNQQEIIPNAGLSGDWSFGKMDVR